MQTFKVTSKATGEPVYQYEAEQPIEWNGYSFALFDHIALPTTPIDLPALQAEHATYIDHGPFFDRFGAAKMAVLVSTDPVVRGIIQDCMSRKWIDLLRPDVGGAIDALMSKVPAITADIKAAVLHLPVAPEENFALRKLYFSETMNG